LERSKRGKRGKAESGFVVVGARPPYGYRVKAESHKAWLEIDKEEERIICLVYQWYVYGDETGKCLSILEIARRLTKMRIPTRGDKQAHVAKKREWGIWSGAMVRHILTNETYTGTWYYGKTRMVDDGQARPTKAKRGFGKQVARPRDEWIAVTVPSIINAQVFRAAQERLSLNKEQAQRNARREYLLGRRLHCAKCGYTYVGRTRREKNRYYICNGGQQIPVKVCNMPNFRGDLVDETVWQWVKDIIQHPESLAEGLLNIQEETNRANQALLDRLSIVEAQLAETEVQLSRLLDLYLSGDFPKEILVERKTRLEETVANLRKEHADLSSHINTVMITDEQLAEIEGFCTGVRDGLDNAAFEDKRRLFDLLDVRGTLAVENGEKVVYVKL
jgi:site-specific DNA recombinase